MVLNLLINLLSLSWAIGIDSKECSDLLNDMSKQQSELISPKPEYDSIADDYTSSASTRDDRTVILVPTAKHYLGDLSGKRVLDLACGDGYFSRLIKTLGAREVVGIDVSSKMIDIAVEKEKHLNQGIQYFVDDVAKLNDYGKFDVIFAGFLLHYAPTEVELNEMVKNISSSLSENGQFITFNENPMLPIHKGIQYGVETIPIDPLSNGSRIKRIHYAENEKKFEFSHFHYEQATYDRALLFAGLSPTWRHFISVPELSDSEKAFWGNYLNDFSITVLTAEKTPVSRPSTGR